MVRDIIDDRTVWLTRVISKLPILVDPVTHGKTSKKEVTNSCKAYVLHDESSKSCLRLISF